MGNPASAQAARRVVVGADFETAFVAKLLAGEKALAELRRQLAEEANVA